MIMMFDQLVYIWYNWYIAYIHIYISISSNMSAFICKHLMYPIMCFEIRLTTWNLLLLLNTGISYLSSGEGFLPSTVPPQNHGRPKCCCCCCCFFLMTLGSNWKPRKNTKSNHISKILRSSFERQTNKVKPKNWYLRICISHESLFLSPFYTAPPHRNVFLLDFPIL